MSYFLFGQLVPEQPDMLRLATAWRFHVTADLPEIAAAMVDAADSAGEAATKFMVVADPSDDTSDTLISPFQVTPDTISKNLANIQGWLEVIQLGREGRITLYISDGFSDKFQDIAVAPKDFQAKLYALLHQSGDWPSLRVRVI